MFHDCKNLESLGNLRTIKSGSLIIENCKKLKALSDKIEIGKSLEIKKCDSSKNIS